MEETGRERQGAGSPVAPYLDELAARTQRVLGERLVGVYAGGSLALGGYEPGRSDIDVAVVVAAVRHGAAVSGACARARRLLARSRGCGNRRRGLRAEPQHGLRHAVPQGPRARSGRSALVRARPRHPARTRSALLGAPPSEVFGLIPHHRLLAVVPSHSGGTRSARGEPTMLSSTRATRSPLLGRESGPRSPLPAGGRSDRSSTTP